jgi:large subunit ribosomal protein L24
MKLRKGDEVEVLTGKDVGKRGEITAVLADREKVIVSGRGVGADKQRINVVRKHQKPTRATMQGGIIDKEMPMHVSNVALVCKSCGPTRIGYRFAPNGQKIRICKKCGGDV